MAARLPQIARWAFAAALAQGAASCSHPPPPVVPIEDKARRDVPIAICRKFLTANEGAGPEGAAPKPEVYWSAVIPSFHGFGGSLEQSARNCVGDSAVPQGTGSAPTGQAVTADDLVMVSDDGGLQAAWFRSFRVNDRIGAGPLALARARPAELDVYALGDYRGSAKHSRFELGRIGIVTVLIAHDESCADVKVDTECESAHVFFVKAGGHLVMAGKTPSQRIQYGSMKDVGRVQYRLATEPLVLDAKSITVKEKLSVRDAADEEVRRVEGDRVFTLQGDGTLAANQDSIWAQVPPPK